MAMRTDYAQCMLCEALCGARVTSNYVRIGGVKHPMPASFPARCRDSIAKIRGLLRDFDESFVQQGASI